MRIKPALTSARFCLALLVLALCCLLAAAQAPAASDNPKVEPKKIYRIGYLEGGPYPTQKTMLEEFKKALRQRGWDDRVVIPTDAFISPGWDKDFSVYRERARELLNRKDLDLIIAMGTEIAKAMLAENNGKIPVIGMDLDDSPNSGVLSREYSSQADNFTTCVTPLRRVAVLTLYHQVLHFKRLGVIYHDSPEGQLYSDVLDVKEVARERGFAVLENGSLDHAESLPNCLVAIKELLARGIDAFYIGSLNCFDWEVNDPTPLLELLRQHKTMTMARDGSSLVHLGALMGTSIWQYSTMAQVHVDQMIDIFQGKRPKDLVKLLPLDQRLSLNFETAKYLGLDFPLDVLIASDEIVTKTSTQAEMAAKSASRENTKK